MESLARLFCQFIQSGRQINIKEYSEQANGYYLFNPVVDELNKLSTTPQQESRMPHDLTIMQACVPLCSVCLGWRQERKGEQTGPNKAREKTRHEQGA